MLKQYMHNDSLNGKWFSCDVVITHQGHHAGSSITWAKENEKKKHFVRVYRA
jgi:hypothetical protein